MVGVFVVVVKRNDFVVALLVPVGGEMLLVTDGGDWVIEEVPLFEGFWAHCELFGSQQRPLAASHCDPATKVQSEEDWHGAPLSYTASFM